MNRIDCIDISNFKFSKLTAISPVKVPKVRGLFWNCDCECGNKCLAYGGHLREGSKKSCGCIIEENIESTGIKRVFSLYTRKANKRNISWEISFEKFKEMIFSKCWYCGSPPSNRLKRLKSGKVQIIYSGIDRVDSSLGYTEKNCVACCKHCNQSKNDMNLNSWFDHLKKIASYQGFKL